MASVVEVADNTVSCEIVCVCQSLERATELFHFIGYVTMRLLGTIHQHSHLCSKFRRIGRVATVGFVSGGENGAGCERGEYRGGVGEVKSCGDISDVSVL